MISFFFFFSGCRDLMSIAELSPDHKFKDPDVSSFPRSTVL